MAVLTIGKMRQRDFYLRSLTATEQAARRQYYTKAEKFLNRLVMAHAIWSLHTKGLGRRAISARLGLHEKVVRLVLEKLQGIARLKPQARGGRET